MHLSHVLISLLPLHTIVPGLDKILGLTDCWYIIPIFPSLFFPQLHEVLNYGYWLRKWKLMLVYNPFMALYRNINFPLHYVYIVIWLAPEHWYVTYINIWNLLQQLLLPGTGFFYTLLNNLSTFALGFAESMLWNAGMMIVEWKHV